MYPFDYFVILELLTPADFVFCCLNKSPRRAGHVGAGRPEGMGRCTSQLKDIFHGAARVRGRDGHFSRMEKHPHILAK